jgi:hypothetical protein
LIPKEDVTLSLLAQLLDNATIDSSQSGPNCFYIEDALTCPFWIRLHPEMAMIRIYNYVELNPTHDLAEALEVVNRLNGMSYMPAFHVHGKRIYSDLTLLYADGLIPKSLVRHCHVFAKQMMSRLSQVESKASVSEHGTLFEYPWLQVEVDEDQATVLVADNANAPHLIN